MVQIGTIEYKAEVTGAGEARQEMGEVNDSFTDTGESAEETAASTGFLAGMLSNVGDSADKAGEDADKADSSFTILGGTTTVVAGALGVLSTVLQALGFSGAAGAATSLATTLSGLTLSGVVGSVTGAFSSFVGWLAAGSAGALAFAGAIGAAVGVFGVWVLEVTGALDAVRGFAGWIRGTAPSWVRDGVVAILSAFAPLAVVGSFIVGTIQGGFDEGFRQAKATTSTFVGAWARLLDRIGGPFTELADGLRRQWSLIEKQGLSSIGEISSVGVESFGRFAIAAGKDLRAIVGDFGVMNTDASAHIRNLKNTVVGGWSTIRQGARSLRNDVVGFFGDIGNSAAGSVRMAFNSTVPSSVQVPSVTIGGGEVAGKDIPRTTIGGGSIDLPQLQTGGLIRQSGIAEVHTGEAVLPEPIVSAASSGGGGGNEVNVDTVRVELSGDFDPSDVDRRTLDDLADRLVDRIGAKANRETGIR